MDVKTNIVHTVHNVVIGESFARIFRQNMFNCGILAIELAMTDLDGLFALGRNNDTVTVKIDLKENLVTAENSKGEQIECRFTMNPFDKELVGAGGWLAYADKKF